MPTSSQCSDRTCLVSDGNVCLKHKTIFVKNKLFLRIVVYYQSIRKSKFLYNYIINIICLDATT